MPGKYSPQSNAPVQGDAGVPEPPQNDAMDDRATSELADDAPSGPANARQHGGNHYKGVGYEHWDLVLDTNMNYFQGCATKYVARWRRHEAHDLNLLKAIHYVDKIQEAEEEGRIKMSGPPYPVSAVADFAAANDLNELEAMIINHILGWRWDMARSELERLRAGHTEPSEGGSGRAYYGAESD